MRTATLRPGLLRIVWWLLVALAVCLSVIAGRWFVAQQRVAKVADHSVRSLANQLSAKTPISASATSAAFGSYRPPEVAGRAGLHLFAISLYDERRQRDLNALPPPNQPLTAARAAALDELASGGNARAACVLALEVAKCTFLPVIGEKELKHRETRREQLQREGWDVANLDRQITGGRTLLTQLGTVCADFMPGHQARPAWHYLLQSALMGYEPAMERFVAFPMFDPTDWSGSVDAFAAYREYYGPMLDALAQRGHEYEMVRAADEYAGQSRQMNVFDIKVIMPSLPVHPIRALALGYASGARLETRWATQAATWSADERIRAEQQRARHAERLATLSAKLDLDQQQIAQQLSGQMMVAWPPEVVKPAGKPPVGTPRNTFDDFDSICRQ